MKINILNPILSLLLVIISCTTVTKGLESTMRSTSDKFSLTEDELRNMHPSTRTDYLFEAIRKDNYREVQIWTERGASVGFKRSGRQESMLNTAFTNCLLDKPNSLNILEYLLQHHSHPNWQLPYPFNNKTVFQSILQQLSFSPSITELQAITLLIKYNADLTIPTKDNESAADFLAKIALYNWKNYYRYHTKNTNVIKDNYEFLFNFIELLVVKADTCMKLKEKGHPITIPLLDRVLLLLTTEKPEIASIRSTTNYNPDLSERCVIANKLLKMLIAEGFYLTNSHIINKDELSLLTQAVKEITKPYRLILQYWYRTGQVLSSLPEDIIIFALQNCLLKLHPTMLRLLLAKENMPISLQPEGYKPSAFSKMTYLKVNSILFSHHSSNAEDQVRLLANGRTDEEYIDNQKTSKQKPAPHNPRCSNCFIF